MEDDHVEKVLAVIRQNRRLTVREVAEEAGICKSSCHLILTDKLKMRRVAAKFVPRLLTDVQKENRILNIRCNSLCLILKIEQFISPNRSPLVKTNNFVSCHFPVRLLV